MLTLDFSIIGISESWLDENSKTVYSIHGYNNEHSERKHKKGGGVSIFIKDCIKYTRRSDLDIMNDYVEAIFIEIKKSELKTKNRFTCRCCL